MKPNTPKQSKSKRSRKPKRQFQQQPNTKVKTTEQQLYTPKQTINTFNAYDESIIIKKRQAIMTVSANNDGSFRLTSSTDAGITSLNPGNSSMGWLSQVATAYTKYQVLHFQLEYIPSASTTSVGNVALYIDYEGNDPVPDDIQQFYDQKDNVVTPVYKQFNKNFAIKDLMSTVKEKQISSEPGFDILYDMGNLYVASQGFTRDGGVLSQVGTLYMTYHIKLMIPQHNNNIAQLQAVGYKFENTEIGWLSHRTGHLAFNTVSQDMHGLPQYYKAHTRCVLNIMAFTGYVNNQGQYAPILSKNQIEVEPVNQVRQLVDASYQHVQYWQIPCKAGDLFEFNYNHNSDNYNYVAVKIFSANIDGTIGYQLGRKLKGESVDKTLQDFIPYSDDDDKAKCPKQPVLTRQNKQR